MKIKINIKIGENAEISKKIIKIESAIQALTAFKTTLETMVNFVYFHDENGNFMYKVSKFKIEVNKISYELKDYGFGLYNLPSSLFVNDTDYVVVERTIDKDHIILQFNKI
jgi:hypothetical protein